MKFTTKIRRAFEAGLRKVGITSEGTVAKEFHRNICDFAEVPRSSKNADIQEALFNKAAQELQDTIGRQSSTNKKDLETARKQIIAESKTPEQRDLLKTL